MNAQKNHYREAAHRLCPMPGDSDSNLNPSNPMETLIAKTNLMKTEWYLCDARNAFLGAFSTLQALADWCRANGYRYRVD